MSVNVGEVYAILGLDKSKFESDLKSADSSFNSFGNSLTSKASTIGKTIGAALVVSTAALTSVATVGVKSYADIESAAADAASKMDLSAIASANNSTVGESFVNVKEHVIDLSRELGTLSTNSFDPNEIASAMANLAAGGFDVATASCADLAPILSLATAANYDLNSSAEVAMATMNQYGMSVSDLGHISDVYTLASGKSAAGMSDFKDAMSYVGPAAQNANVSLEESVAMIGKLRDVGIPASTVGTSLRDGFQTLVAPVGTAEKAINAIGLTLDDVSLKDQDFIDVLAKMKVQADATGQGAEAFIRIFGVTGDTLYNLAGMAPEVDTLTASLENSNGAAEEMAGFMSDSLTGAFNTALGSATDLAISIGEYLAPTLESTFKWFSTEGSVTIQKFIDACANADWDTVGEILTTSFEDAFTFITDIGSEVWEYISEPAIEAFELIAGAAGVGLAIAALSSYGSVLATTAKSLVAFGVKGAASFAMIATSAAGSALSSALASVVGFASTTGKQFVIMATTATSSFLTAKIAAVSSFVSMETAALSAKLSFISTWAAAIGPIAGVVTAIATVSAGLGLLGYSLDPSKFTTFNKVAVDAFNGIKSVVTDCWTSIEEGDFSGVATKLKNAFSSSVEYIKNIDWNALGSDIVTMIGDGANAIITTALDIGGWVYDDVTSWIDSGGAEDLGTTVGNTLISGVESIIGNLSGTSIWDTIKSTMGTASDWLQLGIDIATELGKGLYTSIEPYIISTYNIIVLTFAEAKVYLLGWKNDISNAFIGVWDTLKTETESAFNNATNGINTILTSTATKISDVISALSKPITWSSLWERAGNDLAEVAKQIDKLSKLDIEATLKEFVTGGYLEDEKTSTESKTTRTSTRPKTTEISTESYDPSKVSLSSTNNKYQTSTKTALGLEELYGNTKLTKPITTTEVKTIKIQSVETKDPNALYKNQYGATFKGNEISNVEFASGKFTKVVESNNKVNEINNKLVSTTTQNTASTTQNTASTNKNIQTQNEIGQQLKISYTKKDPITGKTENVLWYQDQIDAWEAATEGIIAKQQAAAEKEEAEKIKTNAEIANTLTVASKNVKYSFYDGSKSMDYALTAWKAYGSQSNNWGIQLANAMKSSVQATTTASNYISASYTQASQNALTISSQVCANFASGGNAVKIGLTSTGQQIAIIGSVAQRTYSEAGNKFIADANVTSGIMVSGAKSASEITVNGAKSATEISVNGAKSFSDVVVKSTDGLANKLSSAVSVVNGVAQIGKSPKSTENKAPDDTNWTNEYFEEITNSSTTKIEKSVKSTTTAINQATTNVATTSTKINNNSTTVANAINSNYKQTAYLFSNVVNSGSTVLSNTNAKVNTNTITTANTVNTNTITTANTANALTLSGVNNAGIVWKTVNANSASTVKTTGETLVKHVTDADSGLCAAGDNVEESLKGGANAIDKSTTALNQCSITIGTTVSNIIGLANRGGGAVWGGTSVSGGGAWIGTGSTAVGGRGYVNWGGTAASIAASNYSSGSIGSVRWGAKGGLFDNGPEIIGIGEKGTELVLPENITNTLIYLTDLGLSKTKNDKSEMLSIQMPINQLQETFTKNTQNITKEEIKQNMNMTLIIEVNGKQLAREIMPFALGEEHRAGLKLKH